MAVNKVVFGAVAIMDISDSTVTEDTLAEGATAYRADGEKITGKMKAASDPTLQAKTVTPTTAKQTVTADSGYDGLSKVEVNAMPTATQATPSITVSSGGLITAKATQSAGYVASGTKQATKQLTTQSAKTVTPSKSTQTAVASGRYTTGAVTVAPIPDTYIQPSGTLDVTENGTHDVKNYESVNVNVAGSGGGGSSGGFPNGTEWTQSNVTSETFKTVYNANGLWVAGSNGDKGLYYSTDGKSWTRSNVTSSYVYTVYNVNGIWVAGSDTGLYYSIDGKSWTQSNVTSGAFYTVYNANGLWVAGCNTGLYYSVTWEPIT